MGESASTSYLNSLYGRATALFGASTVAHVEEEEELSEASLRSPINVPRLYVRNHGTTFEDRLRYAVTKNEYGFRSFECTTMTMVTVGVAGAGFLFGGTRGAGRALQTYRQTNKLSTYLTPRDSTRRMLDHQMIMYVRNGVPYAFKFGVLAGACVGPTAALTIYRDKFSFNYIAATSFFSGATLTLSRGPLGMLALGSLCAVATFVTLSCPSWLIAYVAGYSPQDVYRTMERLFYTSQLEDRIYRQEIAKIMTELDLRLPYEAYRVHRLRREEGKYDNSLITFGDEGGGVHQD